MSLARHSMRLRECTVEQPAPETCTWPLDHPEYRDWLERRNIDKHQGLLRLTGHPGSGKSVLIKALAAACVTNAKCPGTRVATFFFDANGTFDQNITKGLLKALLFQLLPVCPVTFEHFKRLHKLNLIRNDKVDDSESEWFDHELKEILSRFAKTKRDEPVYIFVDAIDECQNTEARDVAILLQNLANMAYDTSSNLNICMSCRRHPTVSIRYCAEIYVDAQNHGDIERYVDRELDQYEMEPSTKNDIKDILTSKAGGVFLWVRLVLDSISRSFDAGLSLDLVSLLGYLSELPGTLHKLFDRILEKFSSLEQLKALRLFQWAMLARRPLSAIEWVHILAFVDEPELRSINEWSESKFGVHSMEQLAKRIRSMTGGLLEVTLQHTSRESTRTEATFSKNSLSLTSNVSANAGSMKIPGGEDNPVVQFIHLSVYQYFLTEEGFRILKRDSPSAWIDDGHLYIAATCLRYCCLQEMSPLLFGNDSFVAARSDTRLTTHKNSSGTNLSITSFGSSAASSSRRSSSPIAEVDTIPLKTLALDEIISEPRSWFFTAWLETMSRGSDSIAQVSPASNAHAEPLLVHDTIAQSVNTEGSLPLDDLYDNVSAPEAQFPLKEDLALRLYALEMFIHHVAEADDSGLDPSELLQIVERDRDSNVQNGCWYKWLQLRNGINPNTTPVYFAAARDLKTWIQWYAHSSSLTTMMAIRGGELQYPLLVALYRSSGSVIELLSHHVDPNIPVKDAWTLLHRIAAKTVKKETLMGHRCGVDRTIETLLRFNRLAARRVPDEVLEDGLVLVFRRFMRSASLRSSVMRKLLYCIDGMNKTELSQADYYFWDSSEDGAG